MKYVWPLLLVLAIATVAYSHYVINRATMTASVAEIGTPSARTQSVSIGNATIEAEVASTEATREQGLSGRASLADGKGMLFVFDSADTWGIWMKDMNFPIDIVWISPTSTILNVDHRVATSTYPTVFYPDAPALYVLELPAGYAKKEGIAAGQKVVLQ